MIEQLPDLPHSPGVYVFRNSDNKALYIGKSVNLRARVQSYFQKGLNLPPKTRELVKHIDSVEIIQTESEIEALLLEAALIQTVKPKYNVMLKDDKNYLYIQATDSFYKRSETNVNVRTASGKRTIYHADDAFPKIQTARRPNDAESIYFGPFPKGKTVKRVIKVLRKMFGWCQYKSREDMRKACKACFYYHIGLCPGVCAGKMTYEDYVAHIDRIVQFLRGDRKHVIKDITAKMKKAAATQNFEKAQYYKQLIDRFEYITQEFVNPSQYITSPVLDQEKFYFARKQLTELLGEVNAGWAVWLKNLERIEAYDISNTQGTNPTASMVVCIEGEPDTSLYRRFKIKTITGPDDFKMMGEVLQRRLQYLTQDVSAVTDESFAQIPQLLIVDGGKGQLSEALHQVSMLGLAIPVIGIAKKEETLVVPRLETTRRSYVEVRLPLDSPALQLVQRIRDEAHRFAKKYHVHLRRNQ